MRKTRNHIFERKEKEWCDLTPAGALLVEDAVAAFTALDDISRLQGVLSPAI